MDGWDEKDKRCRFYIFALHSPNLFHCQVVVLLQGRYAGKKAVVVRST